MDHGPCGLYLVGLRRGRIDVIVGLGTGEPFGKPFWGKTARLKGLTGKNVKLRVKWGTDRAVFRDEGTEWLGGLNWAVMTGGGGVELLDKGL